MMLLQKKHHDSFGKTEMWYVMQADENSRVIADFNEKINPDEFVKKNRRQENNVRFGC